MDALLFRTRATALWLAVAVAATASLLLYLFIPGALEELLAGEMEGETLTEAFTFFLAVLIVIPLVMAAIALLVSDRANCYANLIVGAAFGLFAVFAVVTHTLDGGFNVHVLMVALAGVAAFLVAGLSLVRLRTPTA
jgi:hypothetical protein